MRPAGVHLLTELTEQISGPEKNLSERSWFTADIFLVDSDTFVPLSVCEGWNAQLHQSRSGH